MAVDDRPRDRQSLAAAAPDLLGREEGVEHALGDLGGDTAAAVGDGDRYVVRLGGGADVDAAALAGVSDDVRDRVTGVDDHVEHYLNEVAGVALYQRDLAEIAGDIRDMP